MPGLSGLSNHCRDRNARLPPPLEPPFDLVLDLSAIALVCLPGACSYVAPALSRQYEPGGGANSTFRLRRRLFTLAALVRASHIPSGETPKSQRCRPPSSAASRTSPITIAPPVAPSSGTG